MSETVAALMQDRKGILAADESIETMNKRLEAVGVAPTAESRAQYRTLLVTTPAIEQYLSGVIFFEETLRLTVADGTAVPKFLASKNILSGIKVDQGIGDDGLTRGLDGLRERLVEYKNLGATFTKWRATAKVGDARDSATLGENAERFAAYVSECHALNLVPIVEPEVLMDGTHSAEEAEAAIIQTIAGVCDVLKRHGVDLTAVVLKTSMAVSGKSATTRANAAEVAERTVRALTTSVPDHIGGVVFLSGGQAPDEAMANLNAIARLEPLPWSITFSFARALQEPVLDLWRGDPTQTDEAQSLFLQRLMMAAAADAAGYVQTMK